MNLVSGPTPSIDSTPIVSADARAGARTTGAPLKAETAEVMAIDSMMRVDATCIAKAQAARGQHGVQAVEFSMLTG